MKYLIRSVKYFFYFSIVCSLIITILVLIGAVEGNVNAIFEEGYKSVFKIAIFFLLVASVYPKLGFINRVQSPFFRIERSGHKAVQFADPYQSYGYRRHQWLSYPRSGRNNAKEDL